MLRYVIASLLLLVPTFAVAQQASPKAKPQQTVLMCGPADTVLNSMQKKGFKIGGYGDMSVPGQDTSASIVIVYNVDTRSMKILLMAETAKGPTVCLLNEVENFNTKRD